MEEREWRESYIELKPIFKRIKILVVVDAECEAYEGEYIDHNVHSILDSTSETFPMDKYFATIPPRICQIDLEGLTYYKNHELPRKVLHYDNEECIFAP